MGHSLTLLAPAPRMARSELRDAVRAGLTASPKSLPCRFFYDREGSRLFEEICRLPEYYLPRAERVILRRHADDVAGLLPLPVTLVELGSGSAAKTRILIEALLRRQRTLRFVPIDLSRDMLEESSWSLLRRYPTLEVTALAHEYETGLRWLASELEGPKLVLWLGSNVGNLERREASRFLGRVRRTMSARDRFLIGVDLRKARPVLERAYDDPHGVTARFNLNILARVNRELGGRFDLAQFRHRAFYDEKEGRIEMHLVSRRPQEVVLEDLDLEVRFRRGETIHTETSTKYSLEELEALAAGGGFALERRWLDSQRRFSVSLLSPAR
jgi:L-histidine Nalpha-methyltransferase